MSQRIPFLALCLLTILTACDSDSIESVVAPSLHDSGLQEYVDRFEQEAAARGRFIDVAQLGVRLSFRDIPRDNVLGVCYFQSHAPNRIEIDQPVWNRLSDSGREYVVFHELGHCVLNRGHLESQYSNGMCRSVMASGTGSCFENYTATTRTRYLNELFAAN